MTIKCCQWPCVWVVWSTVWPEVGIKSSLNFYKSCPKSSRCRFNMKNNIFSKYQQLLKLPNIGTLLRGIEYLLKNCLDIVLYTFTKYILKSSSCEHVWPVFDLIDDLFFKNGPFPASFSLFSSFQYSWQWIFNLKFCWWLDSNRGPLESEATALPTEPQPLRQCFNVLVAKFLSDYLLLARIKVWWKRWTNNLGAKMSRRDKSSKSSVTDLGGGWDHPRTKSEKKKARNFLYGKSFQLATESFRIFFIKIAVVAELLQKSLLTPEIRGSIPVISCLYLLSTE